MASLAQLTRLSCLHCSDSLVTEAGLQHLTALRQLRTLHVCGPGIRSAAARACLLSTAQHSTAWMLADLLLLQSPITADDLDVWQQLSRALASGADDEGVVGS